VREAQGLEDWLKAQAGRGRNCLGSWPYGGVEERERGDWFGREEL
jgi:hypothetical protein